MWCVEDGLGRALMSGRFSVTAATSSGLTSPIVTMNLEGRRRAGSGRREGMRTKWRGDVCARGVGRGG